MLSILLKPTVCSAQTLLQKQASYMRVDESNHKTNGKFNKSNSCDIALCWSPYPFFAKHLKHLELHLSSLSGQETVCGQASRISFRPIRNNITLKLIYSYQPWRVAQGTTLTKITNNTTQISPSFRSVVREYSLCLQYYI